MLTIQPRSTRSSRLSRRRAADFAQLVDMHTYCRPLGSPTERAFITKYVATIPGITEDEYGNWSVTIGDRPVIFSCHTDTVHRQAGRQRVHLSRRGLLSLAYASQGTSACLGADDTAGVFLCRSLALAGVSGRYIFHYGEERGGIGSRALATHRADWFAGYTAAMAFDRRGTADIITHQGWGRCCSDAFAHGLADALNAAGTFRYEPDDTGVYTDTAEYVDLVPECTNVSVGYRHEHTPQETLDLRHVVKLRDALLHLDTDALPIARTATADSDALDWFKDWPALDDHQPGSSLQWRDAGYLDAVYAEVQRDLRAGLSRRYQ